jgi:UDP-N-acetylmuramate--alanine ligase
MGGILVIDDYAHHPTEIRETLAATRIRYPGRSVWAVWQPHTYSRTRRLLSEFANAFSDADHVLVTDVYAAREAVDPDFSANQVVQNMRHLDAHFIKSLTQASGYLVSHLRSGDVLIVFSAGDAHRISTEVLDALREEADKNVQNSAEI